jgi:hypothetical protein
MTLRNIAYTRSHAHIAHALKLTELTLALAIYARARPRTRNHSSRTHAHLTRSHTKYKAQTHVSRLMLPRNRNGSSRSHAHLTHTPSHSDAHSQHKAQTHASGLIMLPRITPLAIAMIAHVHTHTSPEPPHGVWAHGLQLSPYPHMGPTMRAPTLRARPQCAYWVH